MLRYPFSRRQFLLSTLAASAAAAAAASGRPAWSAEGKVLRIRQRQDIQILDPGWMIGGIEIDSQYMTQGSLAVFSMTDGQLGWVPSDFVESVQQTDPLHIEFKLKPGIKWNAGGELSAEDVKFSYERMADPKNEAPWKDKWKALDHVDVKDALSGTIVLKEPFSPLFFTTICDGTGSILSKAAVEKAGGKFTTEFPAMCGPYLLKAWLPKQRLEFAANPDWPGPKPAFAEVHFVIIEDDKAAETGYEAGDLDLSEISEESFKRYKASPPEGTRVYEANGTWWTWLGLNSEHPKLKDIRVRQAIQNAVDVESIIQGAFGGLAARSRGIVPPGLIGHRTTTKFEKPDLDKARALLKEAGVEGLELELKTLPNTDRLTMAQIIQANLGEIGIEVTVTPVDSGPFWNLGLEAQGEDWKDLQLWIMEFGDSPDPSQSTQWYISPQVGVWNWERWKSDEYDKLHADGQLETDPVKRDAIYQRMQEIMEDTGAYVWLVHRQVNVVYRDWMEPVILPGNHPYAAWFKQV
jgi:peptide/nickel transport system substrate-binding protein